MPTHDAGEAAHRDLARARAHDLWPDAVDWLRREVIVGEVERIRELYAEDPKMWFAPYHFTGGMRIRNQLRHAGLGEETFGIENLDNVYIVMLEEAAGCGVEEEDA